jgi:hypothetical protein
MSLLLRAELHQAKRARRRLRWQYPTRTRRGGQHSHESTERCKKRGRRPTMMIANTIKEAFVVHDDQTKI